MSGKYVKGLELDSHVKYRGKLFQAVEIVSAKLGMFEELKLDKCG